MGHRSWVSFLFILCVLFVCSLWASGHIFALEINESKAKAAIKQKFGAKGVNNLEKWLDTLAALDGIPEEKQLEEINRFWNQIAHPGEDIDIWGVEDYWASPLETLGKGAADCEDYVIGKYFSLIRLGVSPEELRLVYVRAQVGGRSIVHLVLGYYP